MEVPSLAFQEVEHLFSECLDFVEASRKVNVESKGFADSARSSKVADDFGVEDRMWDLDDAAINASED